MFLVTPLSIEGASTFKSQNFVENYFYLHANIDKLIIENVLCVRHHKELHFASEWEDPLLRHVYNWTDAGDFIADYAF